MVETTATGMPLFDRLTSWPNLLAAARKTRKGKRRYEETARFELERERELLRIQEALRTKTYRPGPYRTFYVQHPKHRMISAAPYRDRVVHHALVNVIGPLFEKNFIFDSYANRDGKGTHRAADRYQHYARQYRYVLQCDIVKFFPSIDHEILKRLLRSRIHDPDVLWLCDTIIDASNPQTPIVDYFHGDNLFTPNERRRGLPIGNMTSQFWANVYLHGLDNFIKRGLRRNAYVRYVDDFIIFGNEKSDLFEVRDALTKYLERLRLRIHMNRAQPRPTTRPSRFLGYRCWPAHRYLIKENIRCIRRRIHALQRHYAQGGVPWDNVRARLAAWNAHAATANSYALRWRILSNTGFQRGPVEPRVLSAAGRGTTIRTIVVPRNATTKRRRTATTTSAFVVRPGVFTNSGPEHVPSRWRVACPKSPNRIPVHPRRSARVTNARTGSVGPCSDCPDGTMTGKIRGI